MKAKDFQAVGVHAERIKRGVGTIYGIWFGWKLPPGQCRRIRRIDVHGSIGVFIDDTTSTTVVICLSYVPRSQNAARSALKALVREVREIAGVRSVLIRRLPNFRLVSQALAGRRAA